MEPKSAQIRSYPHQPIEADHVGMCKFKDNEDPNHRTVADVLKKWAQEIREALQPAAVDEVFNSPFELMVHADLAARNQQSRRRPTFPEDRIPDNKLASRLVLGQRIL